MSAKIVKLDIQNVMRIRACHIEPDGNVVILGGKNAQGKTSVLESISMAIGGMKLCPKVPIRDGEDAAEISLQLGEMFVTRKFKRGSADQITSSLSVKNGAGEPLSPPQATLDALIGRLAFDPLEFARMSPADARETLRELVGLDVEQLEDELGRVYRARTEAGVAKRSAQSVVDDLPVPGEHSDRVPTDAITEEMAQCAKRQAEFEVLKGSLHNAKINIAGLEHRRDELVEEQKRIASRMADNEHAIDQAQRTIEKARFAVENFINTNADEIRSRLDAAMAHNENVDKANRARESYQQKVAEAEAAAEKWKALDTKHNQIAHEIKRRTEAVEYPIPDLELRAEGVYYQGVPFEQGSRAEKIKVSLAMGMAMNDKLRVLLIRDGSVLDAESMAVISKLAQEHDFQFWIEMARGYEGAEGAIIIDDGGVV